MFFFIKTIENYDIIGVGDFLSQTNIERHTSCTAGLKRVQSLLHLFYILNFSLSQIFLFFSFSITFSFFHLSFFSPSSLSSPLLRFPLSSAFVLFSSSPNSNSLFCLVSIFHFVLRVGEVLQFSIRFLYNRCNDFFLDLESQGDKEL